MHRTTARTPIRTVRLFDANPDQRRRPGRVGWSQFVQDAQQDLHHHQVAVALAVGRHHVPGRMRRRGRPQRQFVGVLEIVPERTRLKVRFVDFPAPVGIVNAPLQPALLLVLADVQKTLDQRGAAVGQHLLERADVAVPALA